MLEAEQKTIMGKMVRLLTVFVESRFLFFYSIFLVAFLK